MSIHVKTDKDNVDWQAVADLLSFYGLSHLSAGDQETVFKNSAVVAFIYDGDRLVGCGRALSDGVCQAAVYNIALEEKYHGRQLGRLLIDSILKQVEGQTVILYTHPQTVAMYEKFGFRRQKTGFVLFAGGEERARHMEEMDFLLPKGYRFGNPDYDS